MRRRYRPVRRALRERRAGRSYACGQRYCHLQAREGCHHPVSAVALLGFCSLDDELVRKRYAEWFGKTPDDSIVRRLLASWLRSGLTIMVGSGVFGLTCWALGKLSADARWEDNVHSYTVSQPYTDGAPAYRYARANGVGARTPLHR
jgi:hypothetical protein